MCFPKCYLSDLIHLWLPVSCGLNEIKEARIKKIHISFLLVPQKGGSRSLPNRDKTSLNLRSLVFRVYRFKVQETGPRKSSFPNFSSLYTAVFSPSKTLTMLPAYPTSSCICRGKGKHLRAGWTLKELNCYRERRLPKCLAVSSSIYRQMVYLSLQQMQRDQRSSISAGSRGGCVTVWQQGILLLFQKWRKHQELLLCEQGK